MSEPSRRADASGMPTSGRFRWHEETAQTMAEYAVILGVITPIVILAFAALSGAILSAIETARSFL
jgi:Flp pilus assembly pilin Flp